MPAIVLNSSESIFLGTRNMSQRNPTSYKLFDNGRAIRPMLLIDSVEWERPIVTGTDLKKRVGLMPTNGGDQTESHECLNRLATRAWQRPVG